uniref:UDP-N-acetylglucosamine--dolichyl-phosphate N-acetylglucosaminephosphotransferase n=2 Tax=Schistocephalus solidus TaxID=70667 RepID=A0A0X3NNV1_SCHSO
MFLFIPMPFRQHILAAFGIFSSDNANSCKHIFLQEQATLFKTKLIPFLAALLSICCMIFLGFADDVLNLRWRHKLLLPTLSTLPLLMVHLANLGTTRILIPIPFRNIFGVSVDIGILYYVYMGMLAVFCTNAINIYAGVNGMEVGQSLVIALSVIIFNTIELRSPEWSVHLFSLYFLIPFAGVSLALLISNWCPAEIFVGDTFCYFAGMTFAVVGILGHFSKTLLLFFAPQVFNFLLSLPQLFRFIPCPRHRLPHFSSESGLLTPSQISFRPTSLSLLGRLCLGLLVRLGLTSASSCPETQTGGHRQETVDRHTTEAETVTMDNLTLINFFLRRFGPMSEARTTAHLLGLQVLCSALAFFIRYPVAWTFYEQP